MNLDDQLSLSFYKEVANVDKEHGVALVQHVDTGKIYVKKVLSHYDRSVFEFIKRGRFAGVPVIHDLIETDGKLIVIEDYVSGHSLSELIASKTFGEQDARHIIMRLCEILEPFHSHSPVIIHRDIKDTNVIIDNEGSVYLIDFDASKRVVEGKNRDTELIGTEEYAAPEQYGFGQSDQRTDIYALGVLLNKMLTDKFISEEKHSGALTEVINKATAIDPDNRYSNVRELAHAINSVNPAPAGAATTAGLEEQKGAGKNDAIRANSRLKSIINRLPYPVRELPGFRSAKPLYVIAALIGTTLIILGFFGVSTNPNYTYTERQSRFYDIATFSVIIVPILYVGNYLGARDRFPWCKSDTRALEIIRIMAGTVISFLAVIAIVTVLALIFDF